MALSTKIFKKRTFLFGSLFLLTSHRLYSLASRASFPDLFDLSSMDGYDITVLESGGETGAVIWLHGLGDTSQGWAEIGMRMRRHNPGVAWILPTAQEHEVTCNNGFQSTSWFDIIDIPITRNSPENGKGQEASINFVHTLVKNQTSNGIPADKIVLGGFSQGAAIALAASIEYHKKFGKSLAGCVVLSGWPLRSQSLQEKLGSETLSTKFFIGHGTSDNVVVPEFIEETKDLLKNQVVSINKYNMGHSSSIDEIRDMQSFLEDIFS